MTAAHDVNEMCESFYAILENVYELSIPTEVVCGNNKLKYPQWVNKNTISKIKKKGFTRINLKKIRGRVIMRALPR